MSGAETAAGGSVGWKLAATAFFVALNGFFVAAEFALVKVRGTRIEALAGAGQKRAQITMKILGELSLYLSACQLGITIASLVLGWLAEPAVATLLISLARDAGLAVADSPLLHGVALAIALTVITVLHMTIGEQAPKVLALQRPEPVSLLVAYPLLVFASVFRPFIWLINAISNWMVRMTGVPAQDAHGHDAHDVEELRAILRTASEAGRISGRQQAFGENVLGLMRLQARHIMLPRVDVDHLSTSKSRDQNLALVRSSGHSRFPLGDPDMDNVIGLVHGRDLLARMLAGQTADISELVRPMPSVPETQPLGRLILDLQKARTHSALVVDEHGTTVGVAFLEDAIEEIVGPIHDEFDHARERPEASDPEGSPIAPANPNRVEMAGDVPLPDAAHRLGLDLGSDADTIGGHVIAVLGRMPVAGDEVELPPYRATVVSMKRRRIARVRFERTREGPRGEPE